MVAGFGMRRLFRAVLRALFGKGSHAEPAPIPTPRPVSLRRQPWAPAGDPVSAVPPPTTERRLKGRAHVIDGDTVVIDSEHLRLAGIDAPELEDPYGRKAKWALVTLCKGQKISAHVIGQDHYGRTVAVCHLPDGRDLSAEMVKLGHAIDWPKFSGGKYADLEPPGIRKRLWRCDHRQRGLYHKETRS
jgi:endonuclease YncB( thermonuclease family)